MARRYFRISDLYFSLEKDVRIAPSSLGMQPPSETVISRSRVALRPFLAPGNPG